MIDLTIFLASFTGAMLAIVFNKAIELWVLKRDIKHKKRELAEMMDMTEKLVMLLELEQRANENNKTRKTK